MAFGMQVVPKAVQTLMRLVFSGVILWYIWRLAKARFKMGYIVCIALILQGRWAMSSTASSTAPSSARARG